VGRVGKTEGEGADGGVVEQGVEGCSGDGDVRSRRKRGSGGCMGWSMSGK